MCVHVHVNMHRQMLGRKFPKYLNGFFSGLKQGWILLFELDFC